MRTRNIFITSTAAVIAAVAIGSTGAQAAGVNLFGSNDIQDDSVRSVDVKDQTLRVNDLRPGAVAALSGGSEASGLAGAVYRVANYTNGGGGDATVACGDNDAVSQQYTAIAGGVQAGHAQAGFSAPANEFAVTASFPGRMDWETGEPKTDRLDGWIVLGNGQYTDNLKIWALCVPTTEIPVDVTNIDN